MTAIVLRGDAAHLPLPDASVDLIVTSPPYFGLRSYTDGGEHYQGQIGSEATPAEFVAALIACTREWTRVLKPSGSLFVNLGDKYSTRSSSQRGSTGYAGCFNNRNPDRINPPNRTGLPDKSLLGLPWRYALACTDQLGLILRAEIVWAKPNGLPESVTDRVRRSHEQLFHFTVRPRYFAAVDEIREAHTRSWGGSANGGHTYGTMKAPGAKDANLPNALPNPLGKLPGSVWTIPSAPLKVPAHLGIDHFAAFPPALVRPIVLGWSPAGICTGCGEGRRPVVAATAEYAAMLAESRAHQSGSQNRWGDHGGAQGGFMWHTGQKSGETSQRTITGYACACPAPDAPTRPAVVLDPFGGTGTTALVATVHGRTGITVDMSADYCRLAAWRTHDPAERARALDVPKPPPIPAGMDTLFDDLLTPP